MDKWESIKTAPTDGRHILLFRQGICYTGYYGGSNSGWKINAPGLHTMWPLPTHWMSLPDPPYNPEISTWLVTNSNRLIRQTTIR